MLAQDEKDIKDLTELIRDLDGGQCRFNSRTTELLRKSLIYMRDVTMTRHNQELALVASIRTICAREFKLPYDHPFFKMSWEEDYAPLGYSLDDALIASFQHERDLDHNAAASDEEIILILCHG